MGKHVIPVVLLGSIHPFQEVDDIVALNDAALWPNLGMSPISGATHIAYSLRIGNGDLG